MTHRLGNPAADVGGVLQELRDAGAAEGAALLESAADEISVNGETRTDPGAIFVLLRELRRTAQAPPALAVLTSRAADADLTVPAHRIADLPGARRLLGPEPDVPAPPAPRAETVARSEPDTVCQHVLHDMGRNSTLCCVSGGRQGPTASLTPPSCPSRSTPSGPSGWSAPGMRPRCSATGAPPPTPCPPPGHGTRSPIRAPEKWLYIERRLDGRRQRHEHSTVTGGAAA